MKPSLIAFAICVFLSSVSIIRAGEAVPPYAGLSDAEVDREIRRMVDNLRNDGILWNAHRAHDQLFLWAERANPYLLAALYEDDMQLKIAASQILMFTCPDEQVTDRQIEVAFDAMRLNWDESNGFGPYDCIRPGRLYHLLNRTSVYARIRDRVIGGLQDTNARIRLCSAFLAVDHNETNHIPRLVQIIAPHLASNCLRDDAAAGANFLYRLGPGILPYLNPYRKSEDQQQAELAELICATLETGRVPLFQPRMYASSDWRIPIIQFRFFEFPDKWRLSHFPDENGSYEGRCRDGRSTHEFFRADITYEYEPKANAMHFHYHGEGTITVTRADPILELRASGNTTLALTAYEECHPIDILRQLNPDIPINQHLTEGTVIRVPRTFPPWEHFD